MRVAWLSIGMVCAALATAAACSSDDGNNNPATSSSSGGTGGSGGATSTSGGGGAGGSVPPVCGSAGQELDTGSLTEIAYDDGLPTGNLRQKDFVISTTKDWVLNDIPVHEAVRFELEHPAKIHGFQVQWAEVPDEPELELAAGLYPDFGYNGFDFWEKDPLWTGTRCAGDIGDDGWLTYAFDQPIEVTHPGLVYVAHRAEPGTPVWWWDSGNDVGDDGCNLFDECQSAFNLPEADKNQYYNGLSFPFNGQFLVRLYVEYTDNVQPAAKIFQKVKDSPSGGHVSWGDYDSDGYDDLLLGNKLWRNKGDGTFEDVTAQAGLDTLAVTGGVWGDYDNDGCLDVFFYREAYHQPDHLMHSDCKGGFTDVTVAAGIDDTQTYNPCKDEVNNTHAPSAAAAWLDLDADGYLDLYVANFNCWDDYTYYVDEMWRNKGDGTFERLLGDKGFTNIRTPSRGAAPVDADGDGDVDLFVNNYVLKANLYYRNKGDGTMEEVAKKVGNAGHAGGLYYGHTIGAAWGDLDNDGDFDLISANLAHPRFYTFSDKTETLINDGKGIFTNLAGDFAFPAHANGLRYQETHSVPVLADIDQDGALDLAITCVYEGRPTDFYWGNGDGTFKLDAYHSGITTENGWGIAAADFDHDGDMDLFANELYDNTLQQKGHWLQVKVVGGPTANREALGATVRVTAGGKTYMRHVQGGTGKGGQDSLYLHFGLGDAQSASKIEVVFPGGLKVAYDKPVDADQRVWLYEDGTLLPGWAPPK